jgi:hypothetical protein
MEGLLRRCKKRSCCYPDLKAHNFSQGGQHGIIMKMGAYVTLFIIVSTCNAYATEQKKCGKADVVAGDSCQSLQIKFDLMGCGDTVGQEASTVTCRKDGSFEAERNFALNILARGPSSELTAI